MEDVSEVYSGMDRIDYVRCRIELWYKESLDNQLFLWNRSTDGGDILGLGREEKLLTIPPTIALFCVGLVLNLFGVSIEKTAF